MYPLPLGHRDRNSAETQTSCQMMWTDVKAASLCRVSHLSPQGDRCGTGSPGPTPPPPCSSTPDGWCLWPAGCRSPGQPGCSNTPSALRDELRGGGAPLETRPPRCHGRRRRRKLRKKKKWKSWGLSPPLEEKGKWPSEDMKTDVLILETNVLVCVYVYRVLQL